MYRLQRIGHLQISIQIYGENLITLDGIITEEQGTNVVQRVIGRGKVLYGVGTVPATFCNSAIPEICKYLPVRATAESCFVQRCQKNDWYGQKSFIRN